jgi:S-adenosylmethionine:tRNA ribosyltransferase-isomerase
MRTEAINYDLPGELIAQVPAPKRSLSRLLVMRRGSDDLCDRQFSDILEYIAPGDCLVVNNTKVLCARFFAQRQTGASIEGLYLDEPEPGRWLVMLKNARKIKPGEEIVLFDRQKKPFCMAKALQRVADGRWELQFDTNKPAQEVLGEIGFAPLPPYIKRPGGGDDALTDIERYQTVYAEQTGAVAAPTAGLHFTEPLIEKLKQYGVKFAYLTLHVGAGTFKPVTADNLDDHLIHSEKFYLDAANAEIINQAKTAGGRIIAVGTTSVRTLESIAQNGRVTAMSGATELFIQPGYEFKIIDAMITNFHLPKSTLIALVAAFTGLNEIMAAYKHAIEKKYRFYSYGDAMLII